MFAWSITVIEVGDGKQYSVPEMNAERFEQLQAVRIYEAQEESPSHIGAGDISLQYLETALWLKSLDG